jgi:hypothetical protein
MATKPRPRPQPHGVDSSAFLPVTRCRPSLRAAAERAAGEQRLGEFIREAVQREVERRLGQRVA